MRITPAYKNVSGLGLEQSNGMFNKSGFPGSIRPQYGDHIAASDVQVNAVQDFGTTFIIECYMLELDQWFC